MGTKPLQYETVRMNEVWEIEHIPAVLDEMAQFKPVPYQPNVLSETSYTSTSILETGIEVGIEKQSDREISSTEESEGTIFLEDMKCLD